MSVQAPVVVPSIFHLDESSLDCLNEIKELSEHYSNAATNKAASNQTYSSSSSSSSSSPSSYSSLLSFGGGSFTDELHSSLLSAEESCSAFVKEVDETLRLLDNVAKNQDEVTGRSNSLMQNCESLLEQQHTIHSTVEVLKTTLAPFTDVEEVSVQLGIPIDARGGPIVSSFGGGNLTSKVVDPRSQEFRSLLGRLSKAMKFLQSRPDFLDSERYIHWLYQLQHRAASLVARSMRELMESAAKMCQDQYIKESTMKSSRREETPLESSPVYQKFRGLSFRMKELAALLREQIKGDEDLTYEGPDSHPGQKAFAEVMNVYVVLRNNVLTPILKDATAIVLKSSLPKSNSSSEILNEKPSAVSSTSDNNLSGSSLPATNNNAGDFNLCAGIRQAYSILLRLSQLENHLFDSLFKPPPSASSENTADHSSQVATEAATIFTGTEVLSIVESICGTTGDAMRPIIIREKSVDELCRVINTLVEDVRSQMLAINLPKQILRTMLVALDLTVSDAQERLGYCTEIRFRQDVQMFEPTQSNLAYPDILHENAGNSSLDVSGGSNAMDTSSGSSESIGAQRGIDDVSKTWYPPLKNTLALLSKLYGVVEMSVFEDFARRGVLLCVNSLRAGADKVKRKGTHLHGDLFLVRHLLILREQLIPFEIRMHTMERKLDWSGTRVAMNNMLHNTKSMVQFNMNNAFLQLAWDGIPGLQEQEIDAKRDLDNVLKQACSSLKQNAVKMLLGPLDAFMAKVTAFVGDVPITGPNDRRPIGEPSEAVMKFTQGSSFGSLKSQAFMKADRIKDMLEGTAKLVKNSTSEFKSTMQLYVENGVARAILLKPIQQDIDTTKRRIDTILEACVDPGTALRELETLVGGVFDVLATELTH